MGLRYTTPTPTSTSTVMSANITHIPNYVNPPNHKVALFSTMITCISVTSILLSVRLYVRFKLLRSAGWDDLCAALATVSSFLPEILRRGRYV